MRKASTGKCRSTGDRQLDEEVWLKTLCAELSRAELRIVAAALQLNFVRIVFGSRWQGAERKRGRDCLNHCLYIVTAVVSLGIDNHSFVLVSRPR